MRPKVLMMKNSSLLSFIISLVHRSIFLAGDLDNAIDFLFPAGTVMQPNDTLVIVKFAQDNLDAMTAFEAAYGDMSGVNMLFDYSGKLNNDGERLQLERPDLPPMEEPDFNALDHLR